MSADPQAENIAGETAALEAALWYARHGFPVFPVHSVRDRACSCGNPSCEHPGKHPRTAHGFKDSTKDLDQIRRWWEKWPDANIGVPTGPASGLLVIDIDPRNGGDGSWNELVLKHGTLPDTAEQITGGGGRHIVFRDPSVPVPKTLATGIDIKALGGYIIAAPSVHFSGQSYAWIGIAGRDALITVAPTPDWLLSLFSAAKSTPRRRPVAADGEWPEGERNNRLTSLAGAMRRRGTCEESIEAALLEQNRLRCKPPLPVEEVRQIVESIASYPPGNASAAVGSSTTFRLMDDAVLYIDPDPEKEPLKVCGRLEVAALTRDAKSEGWGRLLHWGDPQGRTHDWAMPMSLLAGDGSEYRARLLDGGLFLPQGRKARDLLAVYLQTMRPEARVLCVARVGWHGDSFVLPDATVGPELAETVLFQTPFETDNHLKTSGTVEDWRDNVSRFCSGNSRLILAVSCAFAGPILSLVGSESGGVHLVGTTSIGKTTALSVGGSVMGGGGRNGFVQSWRTTANGLEVIAELHNDLTLFLDELSQLDPKEAAEIAYLLANGSGKGRMSRNSGGRKRLSWTLLFMSAGEVTLADHVATAGKRPKGGAEVRLLNIDADAGTGLGLFENIYNAESPAAFARQLKDAARQYYGAPFRAYLDFLVANRSAVETALRNFQTNFVTQYVPAGASGEVFRAVQRFALIAAAGELATDAGITGWAEGEAAASIVRCLESWMSGRGTMGTLDAESAVKQVRRFLETHGASRFQPFCVDSPGEIQVVPNRAGFRRKMNEGETEYLIFPETFKSEVCAGFDYRMVVHVLEKRGFLERHTPALMKRMRVPGNIDPIWIFYIRASILEG